MSSAGECKHIYTKTPPVPIETRYEYWSERGLSELSRRTPRKIIVIRLLCECGKLFIPGGVDHEL